MTDATLADGTSVRIIGVTKFLDFQISCFHCKQQFLVIDMDSYGYRVLASPSMLLLTTTCLFSIPNALNCALLMPFLKAR
jgi:hypothetical protein